MKNFFLIIGCLYYCLGGLKAQEGIASPNHIHKVSCILTPPDEYLRGSESRGAYQADQRWEAGSMVRVRFLNGSLDQIEKVIEYAIQWEDYANIKFDFNSTAADAEIRINFDPNGGTSSFIGTASLNDLSAPSMRYSFVASTSRTRIERVVLHEFGHALGLFHEHQHPDSGIDWNIDAVIADSETEAFARFNILDDRPTATTTDYDIQSIMHYEIPATWTNNNFSVPLNTQLSAGDKSIIAEMYPFPEIPPSTCNNAAEESIFEDFESYTVGEFLGVQSDCWTPFSGVDGSAEDVLVSRSSGNKVLKMKGTKESGGPQDIVFELGDKKSGVYELEFYLFTFWGDKGYYNLLHQFLPQGGSEHASEVHFLGDNTGYLRLQNKKYNFPCYTDKWNKIVQRIDFDNDQTTLSINDKEVRTWQFSYISYNTEIGTKQLSAINFYPVDNTYDFFVDEISLKKVVAVGEDCACTNPSDEDICENFDSYSTSQFLGSQSPCWMPWNGWNGSNQDVRPNNVSSGNNNLRIVGTSAEEDTGGPIDMVLALGNKTSGVYDLDFRIYVPAGHKGYYNILHEFTPGGTPIFASEIYFYEKGLGVLWTRGDVYPFTYQSGQWNKVSQSIDLNSDQTTLYIDGEKVRTWQFSTQSRNTKKAERKLSAIDFYPGDNTYEFYIDDLSLTKKSNIDGVEEEDNKVFSSAASRSLTRSKGQKTLQVFPNPTNHLLNVSLDNFTEEAFVIRLVNTMGQTVHQQEITDIDALIQINVSNFSKGTYLLNAIDSKGEMVSKKVLITN